MANIMETLVMAGFVAALVILILCAVVLLRANRAGQIAREDSAARAVELETRIGSLLNAQSEMTGRMQAMQEHLSGRQAELSKTVSERLDGMTDRLNVSMGESSKTTHENLKKLHERLAVLDVAQANITDLTGQVSTLAGILANKQTRGAFGQGRMEAIVSDSLPPGAYTFQFTLKSGARPDCIIHLPNDAPPLVIDAKFPLEAHTALKAAENTEALKGAAQRYRTDLQKHVKDIREKYLVPGETHDTAFMFVPSESIFAEIHETFDDVVQRAHRERVVIVSPSLLLLAIQVIQQVLRDQRLREKAHEIQDEVARMMLDVDRLDDRARNLQKHFNAVTKDIDQILVSSEKVTRRGPDIGMIGLETPKPEPLPSLPFDDA
jgi:DNA recombination protein RmuC